MGSTSLNNVLKLNRVNQKFITRRLTGFRSLITGSKVATDSPRPLNHVLARGAANSQINNQFTSEDDEYKYSYREISKKISAFFYHPAIDAAAARQIVRLSPSSLMYQGPQSASEPSIHILRSAQFLQKELPVRISRRIIGFRQLPFIVGCNPTILHVHEMYIRAFHMVKNFPQIKDRQIEGEFSLMLRNLLEDHRNVIHQLASGFKECRRHLRNENIVQEFLDETLTSRLKIRLMCEHHIAFHDERPNHVGIINKRVPLAKVITNASEYSARICEMRYGVAPDVNIHGHTQACFPYIVSPLDYILAELLKNAMRATVDHSKSMKSPVHPIDITISSNDVDFIIKISDRGGGIPHSNVDKVYEYHYTTAEEEAEADMDHNPMGHMISQVNNAIPMHGYGFGLPTCLAYARYLMGDLTMESMQGIGTDMYLRLRHIDGKMESFKI